jgi:hypothetical protein
MSIKSKVLAAAATLTLVSGVGTAGALTAGSATAATPSCGNSCVNTFNKDFPPAGQTGGPASPIDVFRQTEKVGNPIILFRSSNSDPALDFTIAAQGLVSDFLAAGLVSTAVALHYGGLGHFSPRITATGLAVCSAPGVTPVVLPATTGPFAGLCSFPDFDAFEIEYAPFGVNSGLCMGVAATAFQGEGVTLQPCGVSAKTVWILDFFDNTPNLLAPAQQPGIPLINGSDTNFSHPFVLTYPANANPVDKPRAQVQVRNLTGFAQPGNGGVVPVISSVSSSQLWEQTTGPLP